MAVGLIGYMLELVALNRLYTEQMLHKHWPVLLPMLSLLNMVNAIIRSVSTRIKSGERLPPKRWPVPASPRS